MSDEVSQKSELFGECLGNLGGDALDGAFEVVGQSQSESVGSAARGDGAAGHVVDEVDRDDGLMVGLTDSVFYQQQLLLLRGGKLGDAVVADELQARRLDCVKELYLILHQLGGDVVGVVVDDRGIPVFAEVGVL